MLSWEAHGSAPPPPCAMGRLFQGSSIWLVLWLRTEQLHELRCPDTHLGIVQPYHLEQR